jgi:AraC-like DNA-binding protein
MVEGTDKNSNKIIPDGFSELIFHYGDPYLIEHNADWKQQSNCLIAGQLTKPVILKPSGNSGVFGIKFKATALWKMFGCNMKDLQNQSIAVNDILDINVNEIALKLTEAKDFAARVDLIEKYFGVLIQRTRRTQTDEAIAHMFEVKGNISVLQLASRLKISNRKLERMFNEQVGVSPKVFTRLIRFNSVFSVLEKKTITKAEASYLCGYFDQAHFNKDFKAFTGEDAVHYFRQNHEFANFFMNF